MGVVLGAGGLPGDAFHRGTLAAVEQVWGMAARDAALLVGTSAGSMTLATLRMPRGGATAAAPRAGAAEAVTATGATAAVPAAGEPQADPAAGVTATPGPLAAVVPDVAGFAGYVARNALRPWAARPAGLVAAALPRGRRSTDVLTAPLEHRFAGRWPDRPSWVVAVRRRDGRRVVFGRDRHDADLPTAVGASCAIPGFFRPVRVGGEEFVDGFVHSATSADLLADQGLDLVVVSAPMGVHVPAARPVPDLPLRLYCHALLRWEVAVLRRRGIRVLVVEPGGDLLGLLGLNPVHALRIDEIEERARAATVRRLRARPLPPLAA